MNHEVVLVYEVMCAERLHQRGTGRDQHIALVRLLQLDRLGRDVTRPAFEQETGTSWQPPP